MKIETLVVGPLATNCYFLQSKDLHEAVVVDPGGDPRRILETIAKTDNNHLTIVNTHAHGDHIQGNAFLVESTGAPVWAGDKDALALTDPKLNLSAMMGLPIISPPATRLLKHGDSVDFGTSHLVVLETPGHSQGSLSLYSSDQGVLFCGDTLFRAGIGRTDLPGGDFEQLLGSIRDRLFTLPDETIVYPGHGPMTTIGYEKTHNPFLLQIRPTPE